MLVRHNDLVVIDHVDVRGQHHAIPIFLESLVKNRIAFVRRIKNKIEHDETRAGGEKFVER